MREFSKVNQSIWTSKKFTALSDKHKLFYLYCLTCKHGNSAGCFYLPPGYVMVDLKWTEREVVEAIDRVCDSLLIAYNKVENIAYIARWFDYNPPTNPKHATKVISDLAGIAYCDLLDRILRDLSACLSLQKWRLSDKSREAIDSLCYRVSSKIATETLTSTETETGISNDILDDLRSSRADAKISPPEIDMAFQRVWHAYPGIGKNGEIGAGFKGSKEKARRIFAAIIRKESDYAAMIDAMIAACAQYEDHLSRAGYPSKHLQTWLNNRCWKDDYTTTQTAIKGTSNATHRNGSSQRPPSKSERADQAMREALAEIEQSAGGSTRPTELRHLSDLRKGPGSPEEPDTWLQSGAEGVRTG